MDLNLIIELDFNKQFFISSIRLNEKSSKKFRFEHQDRPAANHPNLFLKDYLKKLPRKRQCVYRTLRGASNIAEYYDLKNQHFEFNGEYLIAEPDQPGELAGETGSYDLKIDPNSFLKSLETKEFRRLPEADQADHLYQLIPKEDQRSFVSSLCKGYSTLRTKFISHYESIYEDRAKQIFFAKYQPNTPLSDFIADKVWYFTVHQSLEFSKFFSLLLSNYIGPLVRDFLQNYQVDNLGKLQAAAKLYDKLQSIGRASRQTSSLQDQHSDSKSSDVKQSKSDESESPKTDPLVAANLKYRQTLAATNSGGFHIHPFSPSSSFDLVNNTMIQLLPSQQELNSSVIVPKSTERPEGEQLMEIDPLVGQPNKWHQNLMYSLDNNGVPLLDANATIDQRNSKRPMSKKIDKHAPLKLLQLIKESANKAPGKKAAGKTAAGKTPAGKTARGKTASKTITKRKVSPRLGFYRPYAVLTKYQSQSEAIGRIVTRSLAKKTLQAINENPPNVENPANAANSVAHNLNIQNQLESLAASAANSAANNQNIQNQLESLVANGEKSETGNQNGQNQLDSAAANDGDSEKSQNLQESNDDI